MKALTLTQPWATLVAIGAKCVETRSWSTQYRGGIAIHAAKSYPRWAQEMSIRQPFYDALKPWFDRHSNQELPRGVVVARAELVACWRFDGADRYIVGNSRRERVVTLSEPELSFGDFTPGRFGWLFESVQPLSMPVQARGSLGLWEWTPLWDAAL